MRDTADEYGVTERIHHGQRVERLEWSSEPPPVVGHRPHGRRHGHATPRASSTSRRATTPTQSGHVVDLPGRDDFAGDVVHPQEWPDGMPVAGRRVVVLGSGATAVTLLPALVEQGAEHVTMLQRSPSYVAALP